MNCTLAVEKYGIQRTYPDQLNQGGELPAILDPARPRSLCTAVVGIVSGCRNVAGTLWNGMCSLGFCGGACHIIASNYGRLELTVASPPSCGSSAGSDQLPLKRPQHFESD